MKRFLLILSIILFVVLSVWLGYYFYSKNSASPIVHKTTQIEKLNIIIKTVATGSIQPRKEILIKPQVSGIIDKLFIEAGQVVKKGARLARIKLIPSPVNINNAESSVELSRIRHKEAVRELSRQKSINNKGQDVEQAQINYENSKKEEARQRKLFEDGVISEQTYYTFKLDLGIKKNTLDNSKTNSDRTLRQFQTEVDIRKQELETAVNNLQLLREGASAKTKQVSNIVLSTVEGMILDIPVEEGTSVVERNNFNDGTTIASIANMNELIFIGQVDESDVGKLKENMPLVLSVGAIESEKFDANLEYIAPKGVVEEGTVKFEVKAAIKSKESIFLRAGYSSNADIILARKDSVLTIKERDVIFEKDDKSFVEIEISNQKFEKKSIELGMSDGINIEVIKGLNINQKIKVQK